MKIKMIVVLLISIILILLLIILNLTMGLMKNPPKVKIFEESNMHKYIYAIRGSYTWRFLNTGIASDSIYPYEVFTRYVKDFQSGILNIKTNTELDIIFSKAWVVNLREIVLNEDGSTYEKEIQQQYGWNKLNLETPEEAGKYIYILYLVYPQGTVTYSFMLNVE